MCSKVLLFSQALEMRAHDRQILESKFCLKTCVLTKHLLRMFLEENSEQKGPLSEQKSHSHGRG